MQFTTVSAICTANTSTTLGEIIRYITQAGAISGAGAKNIKNISNKLNGRAESGVKALITAAKKYGVNSKQVAFVCNLYQGVINKATSDIVNRSFTSAVLKIAGATIFMPCASAFLTWL